MMVIHIFIWVFLWLLLGGIWVIRRIVHLKKYYYDLKLLKGRCPDITDKAMFKSVSDVLEEIEADTSEHTENYTFLDFLEKDYLGKARGTWRRKFIWWYEGRCYYWVNMLLGVLLLVLSVCLLALMFILRASDYADYLYLSL